MLRGKKTELRGYLTAQFRIDAREEVDLDGQQFRADETGGDEDPEGDHGE